LCYTTPREALLSSIFRLISVLHPIYPGKGRWFLCGSPAAAQQLAIVRDGHRVVAG
jgi:hypothetical protein